MLSDSDGEFLLNIARKVVENTAKNEKFIKPRSYPASLDKNMGVFCTITKNGELRGCIGIPYPTMSVIDALISAACSVCEDPRFPRLAEDEARDIKIEISILTEPELIKSEPENYPSMIEKKYGLILEPEQPQEEVPEKEQFLDHLCVKAGLSSGMWKQKGTKLYKFEVQIFEE